MEFKMFKKSVYPKTKRIAINPKEIEITEKLDGSNICFFKTEGRLHVAQRNSIYEVSSKEARDFFKDMMYKGLYGWLSENAEVLENSLNEGSAIVGEWIGMGKIKYGDSLDKRFYMFTKANYDTENQSLKNILYKRELFIYPFVDQVIPEFVGIVPLVAKCASAPSVALLDKNYDAYCEQVGRPCEGFIIIHTPQTVEKYVRLKNGKMKDHFE